MIHFIVQNYSFWHVSIFLIQIYALFRSVRLIRFYEENIDHWKHICRVANELYEFSKKVANELYEFSKKVANKAKEEHENTFANSGKRLVKNKLSQHSNNKKYKA